MAQVTEDFARTMLAAPKGTHYPLTAHEERQLAYSHLKRLALEREVAALREDVERLGGWFDAFQKVEKWMLERGLWGESDIVDADPANTLIHALERLTNPPPSDCNGCAALRAKLEEVENRHADTCTRMAEEHRRAITALTEPHADCGGSDAERFRLCLRDPNLAALFLYESTNADTFGGYHPPGHERDRYIRGRFDGAIQDNEIVHARRHSVCPGDGKPCTEGCREVCRFNPAMPCNRERDGK